jgi:3-oxoacyl-[acyl-carrier protein] reductase
VSGSARSSDLKRGGYAQDIGRQGCIGYGRGAGLGAATADALAEQGADVAITYVASAEKAGAVVEKLKAKGVRAFAIQSDQAKMAAAGPLVEEVVARLGKRPS